MLRFLAAGLVVLSHIEERLQGFAVRYHIAIPQIGFSGRFGVDIFFVISGFVMGYLAIGRFGVKGAPVRFAFDRLTRVAPLYWIATALTMGAILLANHFGDPAKSDQFTTAMAIRSFLFIPYLNDDGRHRPILGQGWTLDFEILFYAIFAICLFWKRPWGPIALVAAFCALYASGFLQRDSQILAIWADPIIFEFLIGFGIAVLRERMTRRFPMKGHAWLLLAGIAAVTAIGHQEGYWLLLNAAVATALVAICTLCSDTNGRNPMERSFIMMGDWSYSLYLTHGFVLLAVGIVWRKLFGSHFLLGYAAAIMLFSIPLSALSYHFIERPSTAAFRRLWLRYRRNG